MRRLSSSTSVKRRTSNTPIYGGVELSKPLTAPTHFTVLGVPFTATPTDIRQAYLRLAKKYHPDVADGEETTPEMQKIAEAYRVLSNPQRRNAYLLSLLLGVNSSLPGTPLTPTPTRGVDYEQVVHIPAPNPNPFPFTVRVTTPQGVVLHVSIHDTITPGQRLKIGGEGGAGDPPGDLYLLFVEHGELYRREPCTPLSLFPAAFTVEKQEPVPMATAVPAS